MNRLLLLISILFYFQASAQDSIRAYEYKKYVDLAISGKSKQLSIAGSWVQMFGFGKQKQQFKIGYGVRFTSYFGANRYYTTAPAEYINPVQTIETIATEPIEANIDTIAIQSLQVNALNLSINLQYTIKNRLDIGFNIDAIGFSFGRKQQTTVISSSFDPGQSPVEGASPTSFNLLLTSNNDLGSLNSELFARYWLSPRFAIRGGFTFLFTEYTTDEELSFNNGAIVNDRYRFKSGLMMVAVTWRPFKKD